MPGETRAPAPGTWRLTQGRRWRKEWRYYRGGDTGAALLSKGSDAARAPARLILASLVVSRTNSVQYSHAPYIRCTSCRPAEQAGDDGNGDDCVVTTNSYATFEVISTPPVGIPRLA